MRTESGGAQRERFVAVCVRVAQVVSQKAMKEQMEHLVEHRSGAMMNRASPEGRAEEYRVRGKWVGGGTESCVWIDKPIAPGFGRAPEMRNTRAEAPDGRVEAIGHEVRRTLVIRPGNLPFGVSEERSKTAYCLSIARSQLRRGILCE